MRYLNLGCGNRFHQDWINVDLTSTSESVIAHNLTQAIPFPDEYFDVVYHSHLLEHFSKADAESFLIECCRVLRPQGVLRVVVPDLEQIAKYYLTSLEKAIAGSSEWVSNYEWILLEMYDQTVRNYPGGEMANYLFKTQIDNEVFIVDRCGIEIKKIIEFARQPQHESEAAKEQEGKFKHLAKFLYRCFRYPSYRRELLLKLLLGKEYSSLQMGRFRQSGEVHQWMYDRYSLALIIKKCGLENIIQRTATESYISNWVSFNLDTEADGTVYKPDSLFMEAIKPSS